MHACMQSECRVQQKRAAAGVVSEAMGGDLGFSRRQSLQAQNDILLDVYMVSLSRSAHVICTHVVETQLNKAQPD